MQNTIEMLRLQNTFYTIDRDGKSAANMDRKENQITPSNRTASVAISKTVNKAALIHQKKVSTSKGITVVNACKESSSISCTNCFTKSEVDCMLNGALKCVR